VSYDETFIKFSNETSGPVDIFWIDFGGQAQKYLTLDAGKSYVQQTNVGHSWLVTGTDHKPIVKYTAESGPKPLPVVIKG
jgi:hypothetical protein